MKIDTNKLNVSKKHLIAIAVIVATGVVLGSAILGGKTDKSAEGEGHGSHVEAKAHSDGEHHGKTGADSHEDDKGHADGEHHEAPSKGPHGGKLFKEGDFGLEALLAGVTQGRVVDMADLAARKNGRCCAWVLHQQALAQRPDEDEQSNDGQQEGAQIGRASCRERVSSPV